MDGDGVAEQCRRCPHAPHARGGYNSDDITGVGVGGGVEPGGSDDGMTITICTFFALQVCVFAELDESAAALPPGFCTPFLAVSSQIVPHSPLRFFSLSQDINCNFVPPCCLQKHHGFSPLLRSCYQHKCGCENCKQ